MHERRGPDAHQIVQRRHLQRSPSRSHAQESHLKHSVVGRRDECRKMGFREETIFKPIAMVQDGNGIEGNEPTQIREQRREQPRVGGTGGPGTPEGGDARGAEFPDRENHSEWIENRIAEDMRVLRQWQDEHQGEATLNLPHQVLRAVAINRQMYQSTRDPRALEALPLATPEDDSIQFAVVERGVNEPTNRESLEYAQRKDYDRPSDVDPFNWEYPSLLEKGLIGETDRVHYYTSLQATKNETDADIHVADIVVHPEERRQGITRRLYEKIKRFGKDQNFRYLTGRNDIDYKGPDQPSTIGIFQKLRMQRYADLPDGEVKDRFYELYKGLGLDRLIYDDLEPRIELQRNATLDAILSRLSDIPMDPEFIREQALQSIIRNPFVDEYTLRGSSMEMEFRRRLELLAETDEFRGKIRFHPTTRAETEHYSLQPSPSQGVDAISARSGNKEVEYDVVVEILDPESDEWIPTNIELKSGEQYKKARVEKITAEGQRDERLYPLHEYYNSPKMSFVVVRQARGGKAGSKAEMPEESDLIIVDMPFSREEVNSHIESAFDRFERIDPPDEQISPLREASEDIRGITERFRELLRNGDIPGGNLLPSLNDLATHEHISKNAARHIYENLKGEGLIYAVNGKGVVAGRNPEPEPLKQNFSSERNEPFIRALLDSDLHDGELLVFDELEERLGTSRDMVGDILFQLYQEGHLTRFPLRRAAAYYFGTDPSTFHRRYHSDPLEQAREFYRSDSEETNIGIIARGLRIHQRHVQKAQRETRKARGRTKEED